MRKKQQPDITTKIDAVTTCRNEAIIKIMKIEKMGFIKRILGFGHGLGKLQKERDQLNGKIETLVDQLRSQKTEMLIKAGVHTQKNTNIECYPASYSRGHDSHKRQLTIGDLHANGLKFFYFLIERGVFVVSEEDFNSFKKLYLQNLKTKDDVEKLKEILNRVTVNEINLLRLIGDDLSDRGVNDYFILKIIEKLVKSGIKLDILWSNHSAEFMIAYEEGKTYKGKLAGCPSDSLKALRNIMFGENGENKIIDKKEVSRIYEEYYKPNVKLFSYSFQMDEYGQLTGMKFFTHAPVGLETVESAAGVYNIKYKDKTVHELRETIDKINEKFSEDVQYNRVHEKYNVETEVKEYSWEGVEAVRLENPIHRAAWNRIPDHTKSELLPKIPKQLDDGVNMIYVHGHERSHHKEMINLDNELGKSIGKHIGKYNFIDALERSQLDDENKFETQQNPKPAAAVITIQENKEELCDENTRLLAKDEEMSTSTRNPKKFSSFSTFFCWPCFFVSSCCERKRKSKSMSNDENDRELNDTTISL